jgi:transposase
VHLKCHRRIKNGKEHRYWSIVENRRCGRRVAQRPVLYLGEINDAQREAWTKSIEVFDETAGEQARLALFPADRPLPGEANGTPNVAVRLRDFVLRRPRQWGACWLFTELWRQLQLDSFWRERLGTSREGTRWESVLATLTAHRLIAPGSEWALHRHWFDTSAMADLLGGDASLAGDDTLYRCLDKILKHKNALFGHLQNRWRDLFGAKFEVLLYDLTSTYFESDPPQDTTDQRRFGYSRDKRSDCVQVVIALVVTPDGFPLAYEVLPGNTSDKTTLRAFLQKIETQYGKAERIWVMDRGIPTEEVLAEMRASDPPVSYLVGTPKARLGQLEKELAEKPWEEVRTGVDVKLLPQENELYVLAQSRDRVHKERSMRKRQLKKLWARLKELRAMKSLKRDALLMKLGAAKSESPAAWKLVEIQLPEPRQSVTPETFTFRLLREKVREARRREGRYLLRSNLTNHDPAALWQFYLQLTQIEEAFKNLKGDLALRPIFHQREDRIEAHIFVAFLAYCVQVTLRQRLRVKAPGLTPRAVLEKFAAVQMLDAWFPTTDGRWLVFHRVTQPERDVQLLLVQLGLQLPPQSPPRITSDGHLAAPALPAM